MSNPVPPPAAGAVRPVIPVHASAQPRPALSVPPAERSEWLDALRGFALFGILVYNLQTFGGYGFRAFLPATPHFGDALDPLLDFCAHVLVQAKFYSLFSFLFGLGFALQMRRAASAGVRGAAVLRRRLGWLLVFGLAHALLLWFGDILTVYALLGFCLLALRNLSQRALLATALCLLGSPVVLYVGLLLAGVDLPMFGASSRPPPPLAQMLHAITEGSYLDVVQAQAVLYPLGWVRRTMQFALPRILGMFLLGVWAVRAGLPLLGPAQQRLLRAWLGCGMAIGLPLSIAFTLLGGNQALYPADLEGLLAVVVSSLATPLLCLGYVAAFGLYWRSRPGHVLVVAGRTALSQYLAQSFVCVTLFYGFGFGLFGKLGYAMQLLLACAIFLVLALAAKAWLRRFDQGPMEALWRRLGQGRERHTALAGGAA